jgi:integrase
MPDNEAYLLAVTSRTPWNKGKLIGAKPPLRPKHVWGIRTRLMIEGRTRDLAMFNLAIDSKLRGCDVVALKVEDIAPNGYAIDRASIRQRKTGRPVKFELTDQTRQAVDDYLRASGKKSGEFLFTSRRQKCRCMKHANTRGLYRNGSPASDLILSFSARIPSGGRRRR